MSPCVCDTASEAMQRCRSTGGVRALNSTRSIWTPHDLNSRHSAICRTNQAQQVVFTKHMFLIPDSRKLKKNKDGTRRWTLPEITPNSAAHLCDDMRCKVQQTRRKYKPSIDVSEDPSGPKSGLMWKLHQEPSGPTRTWPGGRLQHASPTWREKNTTALHPQSRPGDSRRQGEVRKHQCAETNNFRLLLWKKSSWFWAGQVDTDVILIWE